jgi:hypothetical protein
MQTSVPTAYAVDVMAQLQEPALLGSYALPTRIGAAQAEAVVSAIKGAPMTFTFVPPDARERLETVFSAAEVKAAQESRLVENAVSSTVEPA